ncbi:curli production assembly/transport component CsgF [Hymenobacter weizhouensis]|uniref:curli production assembly/transport component CsgF n=1 Tax=Hymenobacter sp. YIM 151500-1 TaxID=2987689 RepID=UPI0022272B17|nr:curli production assembly/transport component CsgF [Hymenobacter sp. YIM 151500-1]UYZ63647.1 curli assembly protein CsgF [Hymenobacter sp. YIM 151500-1]
MKHFFFLISLVAGLLLHTVAASGQDLVYEPKNPAFGGGNTFNYSWLLSSAQAQNTIEDPNARPGGLGSRDPLQDFQDNLNRQILNQLTQRFVTSQFGGSGPVQEGTYVVGVYQIQVTPSGSGVTIVITDTSTGGQTTVTIPNTP